MYLTPFQMAAIIWELKTQKIKMPMVTDHGKMAA